MKFDSVLADKTFTMVSTLINNVQKDMIFSPKDPWIATRVVAVADIRQARWFNIVRALFGSYDAFLQSSLFAGILDCSDCRGYRGRSTVSLKLHSLDSTRERDSEAFRRRAFRTMSMREASDVLDLDGMPVDFDFWNHCGWEGFAKEADTSEVGADANLLQRALSRNPRKTVNNTSAELLCRLRTVISRTMLEKQRQTKPITLQGLEHNQLIRDVVIEIAAEIGTKDRGLLHFLLEGPLKAFFYIESVRPIGLSVISLRRPAGADANTPQQVPTTSSTKNAISSLVNHCHRRHLDLSFDESPSAEGFQVRAVVDGAERGTGSGRSKKDAKLAAATQALQSLSF
ncbi:unnamed protein product [Polarella glacialis]|uniref:DRBM domain-containing protein n=2 Tax=Polarella glacialis TaxID=89957 RepID=A0A813F3Z2_POLGL|nr:unnamed protein product [Polarella glacialis]